MERATRFFPRAQIKRSKCKMRSPARGYNKGGGIRSDRGPTPGVSAWPKRLPGKHLGILHVLLIYTFEQLLN